MKRYLNLRLFFGLCLVLSLILAHPFAVFADVNHLMINTNSNALMTLELDDSDYLMMAPKSSIGTVTNTIEDSELTLMIVMKDSSNKNVYASSHAYKGSDGRYHFSFQTPEGMRVYYWSLMLYSNQIPSPGTYFLSYDLASDFAFDDGSFSLYWERFFKNADAISGTLYPDYDFASGDIFLPSYKLNVNHVTTLRLVTQPANNGVRNIGGSFSINFTKTDSDTSAPTIGSVTSNTDYQSDVSSSLSDLSSSVDSMTEDLSSAAQNLEYISTSQNLIIQGIDNVVMHISDQLFAFWNQLYNLIHVPTMAKMDDIISAIQNMDLEIEVNLDGLKSTINNMSTAIQNKLQSVQNAITNGYDNSGINQDAAELDQSLQEYEEAEQTVIDQVNDSLNDFEFDSGFEEYTNTIKVFSDFIQDLYEASGGFKVVINLSLMLSIAGIVIGVYRFRDGG